MLMSRGLAEETLILRAVKAGLMQDQEEEPSIRKLAETVGIAPTVAHELLSNTTVSRTPRNRSQTRRTQQLRSVAQSYVGFPWTTDMWQLCDRVNEVLDLEFHFDNDGKMAVRRQAIRALVVEAITLWIPHAVQTSNAPVTRVFYGYMAGRVLLKIMTEPRQIEALETELESLDLPGAMRALDELEPILTALVSGDNAEQLYGGPPKMADQRGLQWIRHALVTNRIGRYLRVHQGDPKKLETFFKKVMDDGYVDDCKEVIKITGTDDLVPVFNGWTACVQAGAWQQSRQMSKLLFKCGPDLIWSNKAPLIALARDLDSWPGLAAIVATPELEGMAEVQHWLVSIAPTKTNAAGEKPYQRLNKEVLRMADHLRNNPKCSFSALRKTINSSKEVRV